MSRSISAIFAVLLLALAVALGGGCGGGGGGGTSSSGGSTDGGTSRGEVVLQLVAVQNASATAATQNLANLTPGHTVLVRALSVDHSGVGTLLDVTNLQIGAPASVATASADTGSLTTVASSSGSYSVRADLSGQTLTATLRVISASGLVPVTGRARTTADAGVAGATASFYDASGSAALATTLTGPNGNYLVYVPSDAARFSVSVTPLKTLSGTGIYYNTYAFSDVFYDASLGCPALLPALGGGATLNDAIFYAKANSTGPPRPPSGCGG